MIVKRRPQYAVTTEDGGKTLGALSTREGAQKQLAAIEILKHLRKYRH